MTSPFVVTTEACLLLALAAAPLLGQRVLEGPEPNASFATATVLLCGSEALGMLSSASDEDWFRIVLSAPSDLRLQTGPAATSEVGDTVITLLDSTGGPLRASDDGIFTGYYSTLSAQNLPAGTYYAAVTAGEHAATTGSYLLDVRCESPTTPATFVVANEAAENNNPLTGGIATSVTLPVRCNGTLSSTGHDGDWDFWRVLAFGDTMLRIRVTATAAHPNQQAEDLVLYLYDGASVPNRVAGPFFATENSTWDQAIDVRITGGLHHVAVRGVDGSQAGSYYLELTQRSSASATIFAGGCGGRSLTLPITSVGPGSPQSLEAAFLGMSYSVVGTGLGNPGYAFHVVGLQSTFVDLTPLGATGCALEVDYVDAAFQLADAAGQATWTVPVPGNMTLLGTRLHSQVAVLDLSNPLGITISNRVASTIGN